MSDIKYSLLLVEDDKLDQKAFQRYLKTEGLAYDCAVAGSVAEARDLLNERSYDVVISDYSLGDGSALDVLEMAKDTPVILVTGAGDEGVAVKVWQAGAYDYLSKDLDRNYLKAVPITVENAIKHKQTENKLRLLSGAIRSTEDSVYITDLDDKIIFVNEAFCRIYGYEEDEILGQDGRILWINTDSDKGTRSVFQTRAIGSSWEVGFYHKRKDGSIFPVSLSRSIIKDSQGGDVAVVGVGRDISERILVEDELRNTNAKLEKQNRIVNKMATRVTENLMSLLGEGRIEEAGKLVSDFHDLLSINAHRIKLDVQEFEFETAVSHVVEDLKPLAAARSVEIQVSPIKPELVVDADYAMAKDILRGLLLRAINCSSSPGRVEIAAEVYGDQVMVRILDDGRTMDDPEVCRTLSFCDCIDQRNCGEKTSLDLGAAIARELIEMHGGRIWAKSPEGGGNAVSFVLPRSKKSRKSSACAAHRG